ncbi:hypothetical protein HZA57_09375 [Candidatus Poribacteria bacterium]|nr:hypothetical protein [Candidatus Poribacteria bacterium]
MYDSGTATGYSWAQIEYEDDRGLAAIVLDKARSAARSGVSASSAPGVALRGGLTKVNLNSVNTRGESPVPLLLSGFMGKAPKNLQAFVRLRGDGPRHERTTGGWETAGLSEQDEQGIRSGSLTTLSVPAGRLISGFAPASFAQVRYLDILIIDTQTYRVAAVTVPAG